MKENKQRNEIEELILKDPGSYNNEQKILIFGKSGQRILTEVTMG